ncbi:TetR/AcrR family transcriptional regulator [Pseudarthrobacter sp. J75]|uniref:TetR/AcrR family transcriptional regulator n=1 Tax=unclassified Pseudarthrobacter TaxID=2647000 RepID=UPI002E80CB03|nr:MULTISPECIES: TetR/AcrR family transcriptional regulator [unclassified Pseudarthrobacter]MEE2523554.1 TetR/AcrR family transcriptional regulator [Pseudarthrobacter sp. J47]MEE2530536.1 TetR/AcrR family transcriptional regulator [Pseudarthrobacter sp. J75]MEE2570236.1 TetR/AcrR family transcriptional regulator [Pseudarthrobacter sp. J64]
MNVAAARKPLRADAARNVDKIISAASHCFREYGPDVPLQTIATTAGVGPATLFRNFADKEDLVLAALNRQLRCRVDPVISEALLEDDAAIGLFRVMEEIMAASSEDANLLGAVAGRRQLLVGITGSVIESVGVLLGRGQRQGSLRDDVSLTDMVRLLAMLIGVVDTMEPGSDAWRRPLALVEDSLRTQRLARTLPPQVPLAGDPFPGQSLG